MKKSLYLAIVSYLLLSLVSVDVTAGTEGKKKKKKKQIEKIIVEAKGYIGTQYRFGGTSRSGMDCSGLMCNSFKAADITLPRTSTDQSKAGKGVSVSNLQKGDLVFFALGKKKRKITHVGLVTEVKSSKDITFIHASSSRGVVESKLMQDYYIKHLVKCRRII